MLKFRSRLNKFLRFLDRLVIVWLTLSLFLGNFTPLLAQEVAPPAEITIPTFAKPFKGEYPVTRGFGEKFVDETQKQATNSSFLSDIAEKLLALEGEKGHNGLDFALPEESQIFAVDDGVVVESGDGDY